MSKKVKFKFDLMDSVNTPLNRASVITMLAYDEGGIKRYWCVNGLQGVANQWWPEKSLEKA